MTTLPQLVTILALAVIATPVTAHTAAAAATERHNVLHIVIDDLRPDLGAYGIPDRHTPTIDSLAASPGATVFDRAYCQQAVCGPSRNSFLSGRRPDRSRSWNFINSFRGLHPEWTSLPGLFLQHGALALGSGKMYHPKIPPAYDGNRSWSPSALPYFNPCWNTADDPHIFFQDGGLPCLPCLVDIEHYLFHNVNVSVADEDCTTDALEDVFTVDRAVEMLTNVSKTGQQFYLGVGLHKPHMPWQASAADFALHPLESVTLPKHPQPPTGMPDVAFHFSDGSAHDSPWQPISDNGTRSARRAYQAAATGMDRKLGVLMKALDDLGLANNTAVVLHGDHGWQLGEHGEWRKMTNFELSARVPLIVRAPWLATKQPQQAQQQSQQLSTVTNVLPATARSAALVELVDIMPTVAELAGLPLPANETFDGVSLVPLLRNPGGSVKSATFSQYPRHVTHAKEAWKENGILTVPRTDFTHMGYSIRVKAWRYTEWVLWNGTALAPRWDAVAGRELYDHRQEVPYPTDFDSTENVNLANNATYAAVVADLSSQLRAAFGNTTGNNPPALLPRS